MAEQRIPVAQARAQNRAIFFRYLSILALVILGIVSYEANSHRIDATEDPCSKALHGQTCMVRTCTRLQDVGYRLSPECQDLLDKVRHGKASQGPGAARRSPHAAASRRPVSLDGGGGGPGNGGGSTPGGGQGGAPSGTTPTPPAQAPPVNVGVPGVPSVCIDGVGGVNC